MKINSIGISNFTCPISIREKIGSMQKTVATVSLQADMPRQVGGTCVSTFTKLLSCYRRDMHASIFPELLARLCKQLDSTHATMEMCFPYFIGKKAPVTGTGSLMEYQCSFTGTTKGKHKLLLQVKVPMTTLCPCSKEISAAGAHNQRAEVTLIVHPLRFIWLEDLIKLAEQCGSCEVYALLKRPDEKFVTEVAYANPMFVEDVARKAAQKIMIHPDIGWFSIGVESFESIHKHSAYAFVDSDDIV
jgi:GTP cyclohydrolase I